MPEPIRAALIYIIGSVFDLFIFAFTIRFILFSQFVDLSQPLIRTLIKFTQWIIAPLKKILPNYKQFEIATLAVIFALEILNTIVISSLKYKLPTVPGIFLLAISDMLALFIAMFFYAILVQVVLSWVQPTSPLNYLMYRFNSPLMNPIQRYVKPINGIDFSPVVAIFILQILMMVVSTPLSAYARAVAFVK